MTKSIVHHSVPKRLFDPRSFPLYVSMYSTSSSGEPIMSTSFTRDSQCTVVSCTDNTIRLFDKDSGELLSEYSGHDTGGYVVDCGVDESDRHILSGTAEGTIWWWELVNSKVVCRLKHSPSRPVTSLSVHPTLPSLLTAAANTINLWQRSESTQ